MLSFIFLICFVSKSASLRNQNTRQHEMIVPNHVVVSLCLVEQSLLPPQEGPYFTDLSCLGSVIAQWIEIPIKFHVFLL